MDFHSNPIIPDPATAPDAYRTHAREWLKNNLPTYMRSDSLDYRSPTLAESSDWEAAMYRAGLAGMTWPKAYGGHGLTLREHLAVNKEIGALPMPESVSSIGKELAGPIIMTVGTEVQKQAFLPAILEMREYWCQGFSEPDAGSDLVRLRTRAVQEGDSWRINGQKIWTSGAAKAHYCLLLTRTGTVADKHRGLLMFAVPMNTPGIRVVPIRSIDNKESFAEVFFDDVVVPDSARLGAPDEGWSAAIRVLSIERATNRMYRAWRFEAELRQLIQACKSDAQLSRRLEESYYQRRIGQLVCEIDALKGLVERSVEQLMSGAAIGARGSLTKLFWSECHQAFMALAQEIVSQVGPSSSPLAQRARKHFTTAYLFSHAETIYAGTTEVQLDIIAQRIMQLPKDI
ncbi:acyl-CoA dehydrogenase family protein [Advenella mimigardefordensis]|uniref:Putative pimeloyl-CoA dehydrogenase large subunit n=1 Tax=Advenella mimigardefordensis (strain DSM 17166 / LMG 22922 / DPN7) TaxID=1247726 RepID=W0PHA0_ADVMD|nr:acyl-CoA dehydrogenase family protein [Advenella mimigardefordensis]AHG65891.1 putative pimeloyl-CoA dehydrogenase large subunit [Advenella mimigardefordensis DPN7]